MRSLILVALIALIAPLYVVGLENGLGRTPQMGWNSWNHFHCDIDETMIRETAQVLVSTGLLNAGYEYLNLDDCWAKWRDADNRIYPDNTTFPSGMFALGEYIHSLGLKFGIYSDAGTETCAGRPASLGYEAIDAITYAAWGIDYLKYDNCNNNNIDPKVRYPVMRDALNYTGRPIFFSMCEWGVEDPATWAKPIGNSWRTTDDIQNNWDSMTKNLDQNDKWWNYSGPGGWNDPDMLEIGNGGLTYDEQVAHFSLWCLIKSPLLIGGDVRNMTQQTLSILTNEEVIALNQDELGVQGHKVAVNGNLEVWAGPLADGSIGVVLFNRDSSAAKITANFADIGLSTSATAKVRDLWAHQDLGTFTGAYSATINSHASQTLRITPTAVVKSQ
jgi:alpha-galactosidase